MNQASDQDDSREPEFRTRIVRLSKISGIDPEIADIFSSANVTPALRLDLSYWNKARLADLLLGNPIHLTESRTGKLKVIGGFRMYGLAVALSSASLDPELLAFIHRGHINQKRRREIVEEEILALPALYRRLPGEAAAVYKLYFNFFATAQSDGLLSAKTQEDFYKATGFDRRNTRRRHDVDEKSPPPPGREDACANATPHDEAVTSGHFDDEY